MLAFSVYGKEREMNIFLWGIFYLVTSAFLGYFFLKEKEVVEFIAKKEDDLLKKVPSGEENREKRFMAGNILTVIALILTVVFFFIIDKTPDPLIEIKNWGIYGVFVINTIFFVLRQQHEYIFMGNLVMMFLGRLMFNIMDNNFYIYLGISIILSLILVYLFRKPAKEEITERTLVDEMKEDKRNKGKKIAIENVEEMIESEKRKRSTIGKALHRIDTAITAIVLVMLIQVFYLGNYVIPSGSMEETIKVKDRIFSNMVKYRFTSPKVNEIVAFKEPVNDKVMFTKRLTGGPGQTLQIKDVKEMTLQDPSSSDNSEYIVNAGNIYLDDVKEIRLNRFYSKEGLMQDNKIYIPKKGDKVKLDKIIAVNKEIYVLKEKKDNFIGLMRWDNYGNGNYQTLTGKEFLDKVKVTTNFKEIIGKDETSINNPLNDTYYTFFLKVEGREEVVLPIMDLKYNDTEFLKLLNGEVITLKENYYMAMGDNTVNSFDSRFFGYVSENRIKGELLFRWLPLNRIGLL